MYDYYLGGAHNFEHDRRLAEQALGVAPWLKNLARLNRAWLRRAVLFMTQNDQRVHRTVRPTARHRDAPRRRRDPPPVILLNQRFQSIREVSLLVRLLGAGLTVTGHVHVSPRSAAMSRRPC